MPTGDPDKFDAFISYRRESGSAEARLIQKELREREVRAFLDVDDLKSGLFDDTLLTRIASAPNFIVILSPHALDRCADERDWLRQEIAQAIATSRNIIPIIMSGFSFPERHTLPDELQALPSHNGLEYSHKYFKATIEEILSYLRAEPLLAPIVTTAESPTRDSLTSPTPSPLYRPPAEPRVDGARHNSQTREPSADASPIETGQTLSPDVSFLDPSDHSVETEEHRTIRGIGALLRRVKPSAVMIVLAVLVFLGFGFYGLSKLKSRELVTNNNQAQTKTAEPPPGAPGPSHTTPGGQANPSKELSLTGTIWRLISGNHVVFEPNGIVRHKSADGQVAFSSGDWKQNGNIVKFDINKYIYYELVVSLDGKEMKGTQHWFHKKTIIPTRITKVQ